VKILDEVERRQEAIRFVNEERDRRRAESGTPEPTIAELKHALALKAKQLVPDVDSVTLCDVVKRPMRWLWPQRIPRGKITLLAGNPGLGKSQITCSLASIVTRGALWPVDRTECEPGSVIILSAEDDPEDTIAPRFEAAEARLERCEFIRAVIDRDSNGQPISRSWDIAADIDKMVRLARMIGDVRLIIIDPISAYLGAVDAQKNAQIRGALGPLVGMARDVDAAVLLVTHLNKGGGTEALTRVMDSVAFVAAPRAAYLVAKDDNDETGRRRLFLPMKNNLGPDTGGLSYQIVPVNLGEGISTARIEWGADVVATTADEAMAPAGEKNLFREATDMLKEAFADGSVPADEMGKMAKSTDINIRTFRRAAIAMGAKSRKQIGTGKWLWDLSPAGERGG
jgi:putative DNA primase/helicase